MRGINNSEYFSKKLRNLKNTTYVTNGILIITSIMYLLLFFNGGSENIGTLIKFGAKVNEYIYLGDWWRLITPMFLHIGIAHFAFNSLIIYFLGAELERFIGHFRFFLLYMASGILGNLASFALNNSISAGASTAIFGMFASTIVLAKFYPYHSGIQNLSRNYITLIILNVLFGLFSSSVDNAGHFGGLLGGYLIMYAISSKNAQNNPKKKRFLYGLAFLAVFIILYVLGYLRMDQIFIENLLN